MQLVGARGVFAYYWQAQQAFELFWAELPDDVSDCQLTKSWMAWFEGSLRQKKTASRYRSCRGLFTWWSWRSSLFS
ncbi:hypothetical protein [Acaryochloris marina]|uniref:Uncharacterized protein n=1 Tax=Acaryochloris marina (strain MBIC 11017) TaxID=329726 RepID=A8ZKY6_ACAM1|nr:hypothetical protein [Acaryochloris marina]ABW31454.1 hypothetical protein AM1_A0336 [Acaryochloris marina MBIC11017]